MAVWLPITAVAVTLILWRVAGVAGAIWRERARVNAHCTQLDAAASSGAMLCERLPDGTTLLVMPGPAGPDQPAEAGTVPTLREIKTR